MFIDLPESLTVNQMAELMHGNPEVVRRNCADGVIPAVKVGSRWVIPRDLVFGTIIRKEEEWIAS